MPSESSPSPLALRLAPPPVMRRLVGVGGIAVVVLLWWLATLGAIRREPPDLAGDPAEPGRSGPQLSEPAERARAGPKHRRHAAARPDRVRAGHRHRRAARHRGRFLAPCRSRGRAARALRPQPARGGPDSVDHPVVRDRRDAEGHVHLHRDRAVRVFRRGRGHCGGARPLRRNRTDAGRHVVSDRDEGARARSRCRTSTRASGTCSAWPSATSCSRN